MVYEPLYRALQIRVQYIWVIDQVWGQDGWILAKFFFCVFMDRDGVEVYKHAKKTDQIIQPSWPNKLGQCRIYHMAFGEMSLAGHRG